MGALLVGMLSRLVSRFGPGRSTALLTLGAVGLSVAVSLPLMWLTLGGFYGRGVLLSALVPAVTAPWLFLAFCRLVTQLQVAQEELRRLSITDELMQIANRRHFMEMGSSEMARVRRYGGIFSLAVLDLDGFKALNDQFGHAAGDAMLREVGDALRGATRTPDLIARLGGEEFVVLLPFTDTDGALESGERLRRKVAGIAMLWEGGQTIRITASVGVATWDPSVERLEELLRQADHAMYAAKRGGRNRVSGERALPGGEWPSAEKLVAAR
ncbi:MAG: hypothetical protein JWO05_978 [Gemmatimonadetes bacterium]|nr:hypothetical protein [Gemmatimonadota bacterium]